MKKFVFICLDIDLSQIYLFNWLSYDTQNKDQFRNSPMEVENLKVYIQQATGHKNVNSLDNYIDIAKSELTNMDNVVDNLLEERNTESVEKEKLRLLNMLKNKEITTTEYIKKIEKFN